MITVKIDYSRFRDNIVIAARNRADFIPLKPETVLAVGGQEVFPAATWLANIFRVMHGGNPIVARADLYNQTLIVTDGDLLVPPVVLLFLDDYGLAVEEVLSCRTVVEQMLFQTTPPRGEVSTIVLYPRVEIVEFLTPDESAFYGQPRDNNTRYQHFWQP